MTTIIPEPSSRPSSSNTLVSTIRKRKPKKQQEKTKKNRYKVG